MTFLSKVYILSFFSPSNSKGNAHVLNDHLTQGKSHYVSVKSTYADPQQIPGEEQTKPCSNLALARAQWLLHQHITGQSHHVYICREGLPGKDGGCHLVSFSVLLQQHILSLFRDKSSNMLQSLGCLQGGL